MLWFMLQKGVNVVDLKTWLAENNTTMSAFGRRIGTSAENVRRYCLHPGHRDHRRPREASMTRIAKETGGAVQPNDFYGVPEPAEPREDAA